MSTHVTSDSGTGLVHCAPAHGAEDYNLFKEKNLISSTSSIVCHVGDGGLFTSEVAHVVGKEVAKALIGQPVLDGGSRSVVGLLKNMNRLIKIERFKHRYPYDWKTDKPVIVTCVLFHFLGDPFITLHTQCDIAVVCQPGSYQGGCPGGSRDRDVLSSDL